MRALVILALVTVGCGVDLPDTRLTLDLTHIGDGVEVESGLRRFTNDLGYGIELDEALLAFESFEIFSCDGQSSFRWRDLHPLPSAYAHVGSTETRIGVSFIESLLRPDDVPSEVDWVTPPLGRYCTARIVIGYTDSDYVGWAGDVDMLGTTLLLSGRVTPPGGQPETWFVVGNQRVQRDVELEPAMVFDAETPEHTVTLSFDYPGWFEGLNPLPADSSEMLQRIIDGAAVLRDP